MKYLEFPSKEEWDRIVEKSPFKNINYYTFNDFFVKNNLKSSFIKNVEIRELTIQLKHRLHDVFKSYVMLTYYSNKGIPDDEWKKSPGKNGESVQFFPNFEEKHFYWKDQFDFYSDIFYFKLFSVWDSIGNILNVIFDLKIKKVYFKKVIDELKNHNKIIFDKTINIKNDPIFKKASKIRNDITHNYLPNSVGSIVKKTENNITVSIKNYFTSKDIIENVESVMELLKKTIEYIKNMEKDI